jgi:signal peptidase II
VPPKSKSSAAIRTNRILFLAIAIVGCATDLLTKHWVFAWRGMPRPKNEWWLWEPYVGVETSLNRGALFGMGETIGPTGFAVISIIAGLAFCWWGLFGSASKHRTLSVTLGAILGGIGGNLYDRLGLWSGGEVLAVRDWILLRYGDFTWPNFNIADCLLVCGAASFFVLAMREESNKEDAQAAPN